MNSSFVEFDLLNYFEKTIVQFTNAMYHEGITDLIGKEELRDMLSSGQLVSKKWLGDNYWRAFRGQFTLAEQFNTGVKGIVVGGWNGFLARMLENRVSYVHMDSLDISESATKIAKEVLSGASGEALQGDMYDFDYAPYRIVVNTSAEHIPDVSAWSDMLAKGTAVIVQSNNARHIPEHIGCVDSAQELQDKLKLSRVSYADKIEFPMYTRFMVIGEK